MIKFIVENRKILLSTFFATIFVHLIKFVNYFPTPDSMYGIEMSKDSMLSFGRWFSGIAAIITSSPYDLQWVGGVVSALFVSFIVVFLVKIFDIHTPLYQYLCISTFVTFPCLTATIVYSLWTPAYMFAFLIAIYATYLCIKSKKWVSVLIASILFCLSLGVYQTYFVFSFLVFIFYIAKQLLSQREKLYIKACLISFSASFVLGALLYVVINKIALTVSGSNLSDYQGISNVHFPNFEEILLSFKNAFFAFESFFGGDNISFDSSFSIFIIYLLTNIVIFILLFWGFYKHILSNKNINIKIKLLMIILALTFVPTVYVFYFVSPGVFYHRLMEFGNYFIYFVLILFLQHCKGVEKWLRKSLIYALLLISLYNFVNANIAYHQMSISYEKTYFQNIELASRIDSLSDKDIKVVAAIGKMKNQGKNLYSNPIITGASTNVFTWSQTHIIYFANYYLGRNYISCKHEQIEEIIKTDEFINMPEYPSKDSIKIIDGVVVVKLSDETYED